MLVKRTGVLFHIITSHKKRLTGATILSTAGSYDRRRDRLEKLRGFSCLSLKFSHHTHAHFIGQSPSNGPTYLKEAGKYNFL